MSYDTQADYITIKIVIISPWPVRHLTLASVICPVVFPIIVNAGFY